MKPLSDLEEILARQLAASNDVIGKETLMRAMWPDPEERSYSAFRVHLHKLRKKLEDEGISIKLVRPKGWTMSEIDRKRLRIKLEQM